ncbi:MAG: serine hydrolase [Elusimicrobiota bacterium]
MKTLFFAALGFGAALAFALDAAASAGPAASDSAAGSSDSNRSGTAPHANRGIFAPARGLIHPLIDVDVALQRKEPWVLDLESESKNLVNTLKNEGLVDSVSIEFAGIEKTAQFDVNPDLKFKPASMVKLPIMIAFLKHRDNEREILNRRLTLQAMPPNPFTPEFPPKRRLPVGKEYSVNELLEAMISRSDNDAAYTLVNSMEPGELSHIYEDLGVSGPEARNPNALVTVRDLSTFLRILYVAGYLDWDLSQQAMEYLAAADFKEGLSALLPPGTTVAQKFGEARDADLGLTQVHDCGFIFHPKGPYMLCVLTRGKDQHQQAQAIARISKLVYDDIDKDFADRNAPEASPPK